ncbi:MAG: malto-oligosyltrehalose synthase [Janthinobacterium lividum]
MPRTVPTSTYRLQITGSFTLDDAAALTDYLRDLGSGAVYCSPLLQAASGSDHGYDTVDPTRIDVARGGLEELQTLLGAAREEGLGVVVDIVPNHLGIAEPAENPAFWDVLRLGQGSPYAPWFDIDWQANPSGRLLLPVLGDDAVLSVEEGELRYYDHRFPLAPGTWSEGDDPDEVHARQHYELVHWTRANTELNYRRFFAVTTLAGVRQEDPTVFAATHELVGTLPAAGVTGLRVDHPDGLVDPADYLQRLRALAPDAWITVEKILEPGEQLPPWPVEGTTGYDAMREVNGVFIDDAAEPHLTALYQRLTGDELSIGDHVEAGKRMVDELLLPAEVSRMARLVPEVDGAAPAIAEVAIAFDVYRSYLPAGADHLDAALALAAERRPALAATLDALGPRLHDPDDELARRMQQLSGATMAKGVEDTAYYRYSRFVAVNEVGANPDEVGIPLATFHELQAQRLQAQPRSMTALTTHDTKRGEDVRARLAVLAEVPDEWTRFAERVLEVSTVPNRAFAYLVAQTLAGAGPVEATRMHDYVEKAMREASDGTTWTEPDEAFEATVHGLVDAAYDGELRQDWDVLTGVLTAPGRTNSLGQKLVQLTMPGIPDVYQGTELWEDSLVDPDNRRPVDYTERRRRLAAVLAERPAVDETGAAKLWLVRQALRARAEHPDLFTSYEPVAADGPYAHHLVGFDRGGAITLATRLPVRLAATGGWRDTTITVPDGLVDVLTGRPVGGVVDLGEVLDVYPVALLLPS